MSGWWACESFFFVGLWLERVKLGAFVLGVAVVGGAFGVGFADVFSTGSIVVVRFELVDSS